MSNTFLLKLVQISDNVAKVFSNGEVAGYIALPENEHQNPRPDAALAAIEVRALEKFADSEHCSQEAHCYVHLYLSALREAK